MSSFWNNSWNTIGGPAGGNDGSNDYVSKRNFLLYIGSHENFSKDTVLTFKAFLETFSLSTELEYTDGSSGDSIELPLVSSVRNKYDVSIFVPSQNYSEAVANDHKYYVFESMVKRSYINRSAEYTRENEFRVLLSNLIYNGLEDKMPSTIENYDELTRYAVQGTIAAVEREIEVDAGFFERSGGGSPIPKSYKLKFSIELSNVFTVHEEGYQSTGGFGDPEKVSAITSYHHCKPLTINDSGTGYIDESDLDVSILGTNKHGMQIQKSDKDNRNWPFGFNLRRYKKYGQYYGTDPAVERYALNNPHSVISIKSKNEDNVLEHLVFVPFIESIRQSGGVNKNDEFNTADAYSPRLTYSKLNRRAISFSIPFYRDFEARSTMEKIASLIRILKEPTNSDALGNFLYIRYGDFIMDDIEADEHASCVVRSFSVEFDLEAGFWELNSNFITPKAIKISLEIEVCSVSNYASAQPLKEWSFGGR